MICFFCISLSTALSQDKILNIQISPGYTYASVVDEDSRPSGDCFTCDGHTQKVSNETAAALRLGLDLGLSDNFYFGTGLWFVNKGIHISNTDGGYYGESKYRITYLSIPALLRFKTNEIADNLSLLISGGALFELKAGEALNGGDGAHYWNLAKNRSDQDPNRGVNGNGKSMPLFSSYDFGIHFAASALYKLTDKLELNAGFSFTRNFNNMINPNLKFKSPYDDTYVSDGISIKNAIFSIDLGIRYNLDL